MTENEGYITGCFIVLNVTPLSYYQLGDLTAYRLFHRFRSNIADKIAISCMPVVWVATMSPEKFYAQSTGLDFQSE